jgi:hypothetical protein
MLKSTTIFFTVLLLLFIIYYFLMRQKGRHANTKAHEAIDHLASFLFSKEEISHPGIEPPTFSLRFGYLSTVIQ